MRRPLADQARAKAVTEEEKVFTARETEMAERRKLIELIEARKEAEREALRLQVSAEAEKHGGRRSWSGGARAGRSGGRCRQDSLAGLAHPVRDRSRGRRA